MTHTYTHRTKKARTKPEWEERRRRSRGLQPALPAPGQESRPLRPFEVPAGWGLFRFVGDPIPEGRRCWTLLDGRNQSTLILPDGISQAAPTGDGRMGSRSC